MMIVALKIIISDGRNKKSDKLVTQDLQVCQYEMNPCRTTTRSARNIPRAYCVHVGQNEATWFCVAANSKSPKPVGEGVCNRLYCCILAQRDFGFADSANLSCRDAGAPKT